MRKPKPQPNNRRSEPATAASALSLNGEGSEHLTPDRADAKSITLLHLSDMQFGRNHRFGRLGLPGADADFDTLLSRLTDDLASSRDSEHALKPDLLVVSGDLAEWGKKSEFDDASVFLVRMMGSVVSAYRHCARGSRHQSQIVRLLLQMNVRLATSGRIRCLMERESAV